MDQIFQTKVWGSVVTLFPDHLNHKDGVIKAFTKETNISLDQIASINSESPVTPHIVVETTGGKRHKIIVNMKEKEALVNAIYEAKANLSKK